MKNRRVQDKLFQGHRGVNFLFPLKSRRTIRSWLDSVIQDHRHVMILKILQVHPFWLRFTSRWSIFSNSIAHFKNSFYFLIFDFISKLPRIDFKNSACLGEGGMNGAVTGGTPYLATNLNICSSNMFNRKTNFEIGHFANVWLLMSSRVPGHRLNRKVGRWNRW